jgi:hypothetical protein
VSTADNDAERAPVDVKTRPEGGRAHPSGHVADDFWPGLRLASIRPWEVATLGALVGAFVATGLAVIATGSPLGHDEAVYSLRGRFLATGDQELGYWLPYRAPGLPFVLAQVGNVVGHGSAVNRAVVLGFAAVALVATWLIARRTFGRMEAIVAVALLVITGKVLTFATVVAVDPPGAAMALLAVAVFVYATTRRTIPWYLFVALPLITMAATYLRFGAANVVLAGLGTAVVLLTPTMWRRERWKAVARVAALAMITGLGAALVLLVPQMTGSPQAPLAAQQEFGRDKGLDAWNGLLHAGNVILPSNDQADFMRPLVFALFLAGLIAALLFVRIGRVSGRSVAFGLGAGIGTLTLIIVGVGLVEPQYLILVAPFIAMVAAAGLVALGASICGALFEVPPRVAGAIPLTIGAVFFAVGGLTAIDVVRADHDALDANFGLLRIAAQDAGDALGPDCLLITSYSPQVGWYSGCGVATFGTFTEDARYPALLARRVRAGDNPAVAERVGAVYVEGGKRQPALEVMTRPRRLFVGEPLEWGTPGAGPLRYVRIDELDACLLGEAC